MIKLKSTIALYTLLKVCSFTSGENINPDNKNSIQPPNILWITCEDISPHLGCYDDEDAKTPNLDKLASEGIRFTHAYSNASVCTPARSTLITGVYAPSLGTHHLRGSVPLPSDVKCFTEYLRNIGYYCTNNSKEDYNFDTPDSSWDESGRLAHWRNRKKDQPFFSVFNIEITHQSQTRYSIDEFEKRNIELPDSLRHDPKTFTLPPYYPDTKVVRNNLGALYLQITKMDSEVQKILDQLHDDALMENTIVFFFSDHGDGLPRGKRWLHSTGTKVPLIIRIPDQYDYMSILSAGTTSDQMVSFVDFAPTILNMLEIDIPSYMQGKPFLGKNNGVQDSIVYLFRDRVAEVIELSRSVRTKKFQYIRNYFPYRHRMQHCAYSEITPIRTELRELYSLNQLYNNEKWLMEQKIPIEELYDSDNDPYQMNNLINNPEFDEIVKYMRIALMEKIVNTGDLGFLPEAEMMRRSIGDSPYDISQNNEVYNIKNVLQCAELVGRSVDVERMKKCLNCIDPAARYWAVNAIIALGTNGVQFEKEIIHRLDDENPNVRIVAAEALCRLRREPSRKALHVLLKELETNNPWIIMHSAYTLNVLEELAKPAYQKIEKIYPDLEESDFLGNYHLRPLKHILSKYKMPME